MKTYKTNDAFVIEDGEYRVEQHESSMKYFHNDVLVKEIKSE